MHGIASLLAHAMIHIQVDGLGVSLCHEIMRSCSSAAHYVSDPATQGQLAFVWRVCALLAAGHGCPGGVAALWSSTGRMPSNNGSNRPPSQSAMC